MANESWNFQPFTNVRFGATGIDDYNKILIMPDRGAQPYQICETIARNNGTYIECEKLSYQRTGGRYYVQVEVPYEQLMACDTIWYMNYQDEETIAPGSGTREPYLWFIGNILEVEWLNPNCCRVYYKIDAFTTFMKRIEWDKSVCYVDREHVKDDWTHGNLPTFGNMGPAEPIAIEPDTLLFNHNEHFECDKCLVYTPYNFQDGSPNFGTEIQNGVYDAMNAYVMDASQVSGYLKMIAESENADITGVQAIYTFPSKFVGADGTATDVELPPPWLTAPGDYPEIRNSKCWSGQFVQVKLMSWLGGAVTYNPQWFGGGRDKFIFSYRAFYAAGELTLQAIMKPMREEFVWEAYKDFIVSVRQLPQAHWVGDGYLQYMSTWALSDILQGASHVAGRVNDALGTVTGSDFPTQALTGGGKRLAPSDRGNPLTSGAALVSTAVGAAADISKVAANFRQQKMTGLVLGGSVASSPNICATQGTYGFTVVYYGPQPYMMKMIDSYFDRFGYCVNTLKVPEVNSRPYWNYVKCHEAHVSGSIPYRYRIEIENMLNQGVTFWNYDNMDPSNPIGDYSNPERNKEAK